MDAVKRMHTDARPRPEVLFDGDKRFEVFAAQEQARQVGGDLYDFYRVDDDRILLFVGDVSGKGLPASYMAAVTKAMFKTAALRGRSNIAEVVCEVAREIARDNANALFVIAFAAILNVQTGYLEYCSAGGEPALLISDQPGRAVAELDSDRALGPPLAAVDGFPYEAAGLEMKHGDMLLVFTDGLSEALDQAGTLYGRDTLRTSLSNLPHIERAEMLVEAVLHDWRAFTAGTMPTDDVTVLVLRWN
jgi:adenylate cyclase